MSDLDDQMAGLPPETIAAVREFARFLKDTAGFPANRPDLLPPNLLRRYRAFLGLTHAEIDAREAALFAAEQRRGPTIRNVPRSIARPIDGPTHEREHPWN